MGDREGRHCRWIRYRWIHEWERLRGLEEEEKDGAEEEGTGKEKDPDP